MSFFHSKPPFDRSVIGKGYNAAYTRIQRISFKKLAIAPERNQFILRAMTAVNDLDSIQYLNSTMMELIIDKSEGKDVEDNRRHADQFQLMMHRRWLFRMACVSASDMVRLFNKLKKQRCFRSVFEEPSTRERVESLEALLKSSNLKWLTGIRDKTAAHIDDDDAWITAIKNISQLRSDDTGRVQFSTKPYSIRFTVADEVITHLPLHDVWISMGTQDSETKAKWVTDLMGELFLFYQVFIAVAVKKFDLAS